MHIQLFKHINLLYRQDRLFHIHRRALFYHLDVLLQTLTGHLKQ